MFRGRRVILAVVVLAAGATAAAWWWASPTPSPPTPPDVSSADPLVAAAISAARAEVEAHPADAAGWGKLGLTLLANGLSDPARECLAEAGRLDPADPRWPYLEGVSLLLRDPIAALPCWQRAATCAGTNDRVRTAQLRLAEALLANGRQSEAEGVLAAVRADDPDNPRAGFDLGLLAEARGDTKAAIDQFLKCVDNPSARRKACDRLASLYTLAGEPARAAEFAGRADTLPPDQDWPDPILEDTVRFTIGRESLLIQAEKQQQQGNIRQAIQLFQKLIKVYPDEARGYSKLGMALAEAGLYGDAEIVLRQGLKVAPDMVQGHFFLAVALFHQAERLGLTTSGGRDKLTDAAEEARKTVGLKPDHGFAYLYLGLALKHLGQKPAALAALREAVRCSPESTDPHLHLGQMLQDAGQGDEAVAELEAAVRLAGPNDHRAQAALEKAKAKSKN